MYKIRKPDLVKIVADSDLPEYVTDFQKYTKLSMACYIGIGWLIIFAIRPTVAAMTIPGFIFLLLGGVAYTVGASLYAIDEKKPYIHATFHLFVLLGTALQFIAIFKYVIL